jgi:bifunctional non-homologous end joining protein LigD
VSVWSDGTPEKIRRRASFLKAQLQGFAPTALSEGWMGLTLAAQIEFTEWTSDGHLRHSKFVGLREDKEAREVVREIEG